MVDAKTTMTLFDLAQQGYRSWPLPLSGLVFAALSPLFLIAPEGVLTPWLRVIGRKCYFLICLLAGILTALVSAAVTYFPYRYEIRALNSGDYKVAEGTLEDFLPGRAGRPGESQSFIVGGKKFHVDIGTDTGFRGFNIDSGAMIGDPEGKQFRIGYLEGSPPVILRVDQLNSTSEQSGELQ